ncbi:unnamed protein product [Lactuca saligna]|uniref:Uncharacterized protein n=1 Tax=Lactuca saligna TaxID=75948 RepID=A0AA36E2E2_LACSI|nr:unnamed protein product [Lactuca saligna]
MQWKGKLHHDRQQYGPDEDVCLLTARLNSTEIDDISVLLENGKNNFLKNTKESENLGFDIANIDFRLENFKDLVDVIRNYNNGSSNDYWRQPALYKASPDSSEYCTESSNIVGDTSGGYPTANYNTQTNSWIQGSHPSYAHQYPNYTIDSNVAIRNLYLQQQP